jgi:HAD superfamily hydrolase (TIGR01484 family)
MPLSLTQLRTDALVGMFTDIDDTLTSDGRLLPQAYEAMWAVKRAGLALVPVTGRSAGWAHMIARTWPVDAVVAESGGLWIAKDAAGRFRVHLHDRAEVIREHRSRLARCAESLLAQYPQLAAASDNAYRQVDLALDYCEEVTRAPIAVVQAAIERFRDEGFHAQASSLHINAWHGSFDKASTSLRCLNELWPESPRGQASNWLFIGDGLNDASMFCRFPVSVAVANIAGILDQLPVKPAYITTRAAGLGFAELVAHLLQSRAPLTALPA